MAVERRVRVGLAGLGRVAVGITRALARSPLYEIVAAADLRQEGREAFASAYGGRTYDSIEKLAEDPDVEAVWVMTPHEHHAEHAIMAAEHGKHLVVEKPIEVRVEAALQMVDAAERNGVVLMAGGSRSYDPALRAMRDIIQSGEVGSVRALNTWSYSGWMMRPRADSELDLARGGSVIFSQGAHQADLLRVMAGGRVRSLRAFFGQWMPERPTPGYYSGFLQFEDGADATMVYDGYGYFLGHELVPWGETRGGGGGEERSPEAMRAYRQRLRAGDLNEYGLREVSRFGGSPATSAAPGPEASRSGEAPPWVPSDAGLLVVSCERGLLRQSPHGVYVYDDDGRREVEVPNHGDSRSTELREFYDAVVYGKPVPYDGRWGAATLEVVAGIVESGQSGCEVFLQNQVGPAPR
jgi:phthalate 4,5-cis-dihydrodiol dehydrogenase